MDTFSLNKPEWAKEPEPLDFNLINQPLEQIYNRVISRLDKENREPKNFYFILKGLLTTAFQSYKAIRKLIATDPKYPAQAHILGRSLIDTLFTIVALTENPLENSKKYEKAGYRIQYKEYERYKMRYGSDPNWQDWLKENEKFLASLAHMIDLSEEEKNNPVNTIKYWPNPHRLLKTSQSANPIISLSSDKLKFLNQVIKWNYGQLSDWSHMGWGGMAIGIFATKPEFQWHTGKLESDAVYNGILFLLMILSEIEACCNYSEVQNLRYAWTILNSYYEEAKEYYNLRYDNLLVESNKNE